MSQPTLWRCSRRLARKRACVTPATSSPPHS
ncbi:hypothetical protein CABS03_02945 [Colletotrichum abscissum]